MVARVIDGKAIAADLRAQVKTAVADLPEAPGLAVILVGEDAASQIYVRNKIRASEGAGIRSLHKPLPKDTTQFELENLIADLNRDPDIDGILLQLPLPGHLHAQGAIAQIDPARDVDGLTEISAGRLALGKPGLRPCTPSGCVTLAKHALGEDLSGKHCVVIGRSILVGKPSALMFLNQNCTVTIAHSRTTDLEAVCQAGDILVPAIGRPGTITAAHVKPGAAIIDVGINRVPDPDHEGKTKLVGDVDYDACAEIAGHITPVPGGVGPMTIASLLRNTIFAACARRGWAVPDGL